MCVSAKLWMKVISIFQIGKAANRINLQRRRRYILAMLLSFYIPHSKAQQNLQIQCDDVFGVRYAVFNTPTPSGVQLVISPINRPLNMYSMAVLNDNPLVALGHLESNGFGILIGRDGGFTIASGGQYYPTGRCAVVPIGVNVPPQPDGALLSTPTATPINNASGVDVANLAPDGNWLSGHWPMVATESQVLECQKDWVDSGDHDKLFSCINSKMLTPQQSKGLKCLEQDGSSQQVGCVAGLAFPGASKTIDLVQECTNDSAVDWKCVAKDALTEPQYQALQCAESAGEPKDAADCIRGLGFDPDTTRSITVISQCASEEDIGSTAACALSNSGDHRVASAAKCVEDQLQTADFSTVGAAVCYAAGSVRMNPELQIAVECGAESDGEPLAFAGCTGGRLTVRELKKCLDQIGGSGCFGPNNDIVKTLNRYGVNTGNLTNPDGELVKAWNTVTNDLEHGIGPDNDILRFATQIQTQNHVAGNYFRQQINNVTHDAMYGPGPNNTLVQILNQAGNGAQHGGDEAKKFVNRTFGLHL